MWDEKSKEDLDPIYINKKSDVTNERLSMDP
jgi:hypothetical protein